MPKRISDVSLHVYVTPETLDRVVETVRHVVDDHVAERDVFAWRFTLPVDPDQSAHTVLETQWRLDHPGADPGDRCTYEIALSLVGAAELLTEASLAALEHQLVLGISAEDGVPYAIHAHNRESFDFEENRELDHSTRFVTAQPGVTPDTKPPQPREGQCRMTPSCTTVASSSPVRE
jgi:hypothetical protein